MDLDRVLAELIKERDLLDEAIARLERLAPGPQGGAGRPPSRVYPENREERARGVSPSFD